MNQILLFRSDGHEFPLEIVSRNEQKWVTRKQLSGAMGVSDLRELHSQLVRKGELREGTHFMTITVMYPDGNAGRGNPSRVAYSYRGIIRVSMHCEGRHAKKFRDWAEDVLYEVMTTGSYSEDARSEKSEAPPFILSSLRRMAEDDTALEKMFRKRREGLTEIGFGRSAAVRKAIESVGKDTGIDLTERWGFELSEIGGDRADEALSGNDAVSGGSVTEELPGVVPAGSEPEIPKSYRGWNLNRRGKDRKGRALFNLVKKK